MSFEYVDSEIHEDLHKIIKYSCGEVCNSSDQLDKVMRIWTTFLEPILGVQRKHGSEDPDLVKPKSRTTKLGLANAGESNTGAGIVSKQNNGEESEQGLSSRARLANGVAADTQNGFHDADRTARRGEEPSNAILNGRVHGAVSADETPSLSAQNIASTERAAENAAVVRTEQHKANSELTPGLFCCFNILCAQSMLIRFFFLKKVGSPYLFFVFFLFTQPRNSSPLRIRTWPAGVLLRSSNR
jgi:paired amphipathic helix protein Sin3a